jgi:hypothetical protein
MQTLEIYNDFDSIDLDIDYKKNTCEIEVCIDRLVKDNNNGKQ